MRRILLPVPRSIRREVQADRVIIRRIWREGGGVVAWVLIAVIWNFAMFAMFRTTRIGPGKEWESPLMPGFLAAIGLYAAYRCGATLFNTTELEIGPDLLRVRTGPVPWHFENRLAPAEIHDVVFHEHAERGYSSTYDVAAVFADGREKRLIKGLNDYEVAVFYVREIRSSLGRPDRSLSPDA
jgi:hypothetical protein